MYIICNLLNKNIAGVQSEPAVPASGVRVWLGFEIPHPYPYPGKNPDQTRRVGDRLVQPLHTETHIFSHFTHFILRPNSDRTPIRLRVHYSNSDITPTVPRHSPSHAEIHRHSPSFTVYYRTITEITKII